MSPNGQTFASNSSVPPYHCGHHSQHYYVTPCPVLHDANRKTLSFLSQILFCLYIRNQNNYYLIFSSVLHATQSKCMQKTKLSSSQTQPGWHCQCNLVNATSGHPKRMVSSPFWFRAYGMSNTLLWSLGVFFFPPHEHSPLMYSWLLLHWSLLNCMNQHSLLVLTTVKQGCDDSQTLQREVQNHLSSHLLNNPAPGRFPPNLPKLKVIYIQKNKTLSLQHRRKGKAKPNLPSLSQQHALNCQLCNCKMRFEGILLPNVP